MDICNHIFGIGMAPTIFWGPVGPGVVRIRKGGSVPSYSKALHSVSLMGD